MFTTGTQLVSNAPVSTGDVWFHRWSKDPSNIYWDLWHSFWWNDPPPPPRCHRSSAGRLMWRNDASVPGVGFETPRGRGPNREEPTWIILSWISHLHPQKHLCPSCVWIYEDLLSVFVLYILKIHCVKGKNLLHTGNRKHRHIPHHAFVFHVAEDENRWN